MHPFNLCSWKMPLVVSTDTKLDKLHLHFFFCWTFTALISFHTILCYSFQKQPHLGQLKTLPVLWNFEKFPKCYFFKLISLTFFQWPSSLYSSCVFLFCFFFFSGQVTENFPWPFLGVGSPIHSHSESAIKYNN